MLIRAAAFALLPVAATAQTQWFQPSDFDLTCRIDKSCIVGQACDLIESNVTIIHAPTEGGTSFELPDGTATQGAIAILAGKDGQSLIASASQDGRTVYRIVVYPTGKVTIMQSHGPTPELDRIYYGNCTDQVSSLNQPQRAG